MILAGVASKRRVSRMRDPSPKAARRKRARDRRHRENLRLKRRCVTVRVGGDEIDHIVRMRLLDERNERDRAKVGAAVEAAFLWSIEVVKTKGFWDWLRRQGR